MEVEAGHRNSPIQKSSFLKPEIFGNFLSAVQFLLASLIPETIVEHQTSAVPEVTESEIGKAGGAGETAGIKAG